MPFLPGTAARASLMRSYHSLLILPLLALAFAACAPPRAAMKSGAVDASAATADPSFRLDSLAALSSGNYIHLYIGPCFGRCEGYVSIYRESPATFYVYDAEGWRYDEVARIDLLRRLRAPMNDEDADAILRLARDAGVIDLVNDSTRMITDQPSIWVRARLDGKMVKVDDAYLGGKLYSDNERARYNDYAKIRSVLFDPLNTAKASAPGH